ncbi:zinc finger, CCHC-type containing protein [Tanacetum coccineum]
MFFMPSQATIPFPSCLYDDDCDEKEGSYGLKDLDAYSIRTTLLNNALPAKEKYPRSFTLPCYINNLCFNKALADLGASVSVMPLSTYSNLGLGELAPTKLIVELDDGTVKRPKEMHEDIKDPVDPGKNHYLSTLLHPKINVERMKLDLEARLMGEVLILNRSLDMLYGDYIELNDLNEPLGLRRNRVDDLEPTI